MNTPILDNWLIHAISSSRSSCRMVILVGYVDGKKIPLYKIRGLDFSKSLIISEDKVFILGEPCKEYKNQFPNARQDFLKSLFKNEKSRSNSERR